MEMDSNFKSPHSSGQAEAEHHYQRQLSHPQQHDMDVPMGTYGSGQPDNNSNMETQSQGQETQRFNPEYVHNQSHDPPTQTSYNSSSSAPTTAVRSLADPDKNALMIVLNFLKKHNLKQTEDLLKNEAHISDSDIKGALSASETDVQTVLSSYASDENPDEYTDAYIQLKNFIDFSLDAYKFEVGQILWPVFVHMYLELVYNDHESQAQSFFLRFSKMQETYHETDLVSLGSIMKKSQLLSSENPFRSLSSCYVKNPGSPNTGLYVVRMSREALSILKRFLQEKRLTLVQNIFQERLSIEVYDGVPRGKAAVHAVAGHVMGEALRQDNKAKVYYGLLREPDLQNVQMEEDDEEATGDSQGQSQGSNQSSQKSDTQSSQNSQGTPSEGSKSSKKKKSKKDWLLSKKSKNDPNAPPISRMPLPELRDVDKVEKAKALREAAKRVTLGVDRLPSICFYTILNGDQQVTCIKWSDDGQLMGVGFASSQIKIWSLTAIKLKKLRPAADLIEIEREAEDVLVRMMDDRSAETTRSLRGHSGPVYCIDFSTDKSNLLSASEDASIRLWSLLTWTCLVVYKGHLLPVWKVVFSPHGSYYFASAGHDQTARLWTTDNYHPVRVFAGHYSDITALIFHPNSNYVATGSADRSVRLWDCVSGTCARLMTGHKAAVQALCFSTDGRFLASSGSDTKVLVWDMSNGGLLSCLHAHKSSVYTLAFSREGSVLATGGLDNCVRLWDFVKMIEDVVSEEGGAAIPPDSKKISGDHLLIGEFFTKNTAVFSLHFTRRNILLSSGPFQH